MRWYEARKKMRRFLKSQTLPGEPPLDIAEYRAFWKDMSLVTAEPGMVANLPFSDSTKYWLTEVGLPAEAGYFRFDTLEVGLPTIAELKRDPPPDEGLSLHFLRVNRYKQIPTWSEKVRVIGVTLSGAFICLEEELDGIVTFLYISYRANDGVYQYVNANIMCLAQCLMLYRRWAEKIDPVTNTQEEGRKATSVVKEKTRQIDPLALLDKQHCFWEAWYDLEWLDDDEKT
jgi:hypothetical protein